MKSAKKKPAGSVQVEYLCGHGGHEPGDKATLKYDMAEFLSNRSVVKILEKEDATKDSR